MILPWSLLAVYRPHKFPIGPSMENAKKRLLLIDAVDARRATRVHLLNKCGFSVDVRNDYIEAERLDHEGDCDHSSLLCTGSRTRRLHIVII